MRSIIAAAALLAAFISITAPCAAQGPMPFTLEARGGVAFPVDEFASGVETGYLMQATAKLSPLPFVTVYGGWSFAEFGADGDGGIAGLDTRLRDAGFRLGGELSVPLAGLMSGFAPYVQAGAIFNRAEVRVSGDGTNTLGVKSDRSLGMELGAGARIGLGRRISIVPEVRYRGYRPDFEDAPTIDIANEVSYVGASLGLTVHF